jgi:hypothetical protein
MGGGGWWRRPRATYGQGGGGWGWLVVAGEGGRQRRSEGVGLWCVINLEEHDKVTQPNQD